MTGVTGQGHAVKYSARGLQLDLLVVHKIIQESCWILPTFIHA